MPGVRVNNYIVGLIGLDDTTFTGQIEQLQQRLGRSNPVALLTRRTIGGAMDGLKAVPDRDALLQHLLESDPTGAAYDILGRLTNELPPARGRVICHLIPNGGDRGSGNCFGPDRLLVTVPCQGDALLWLRFVMAHEYSHTHRGFRLAETDTVRDFLIFEGLGMVLGKSVVPEIGRMFRESVTDVQVARFWEGVELEASGLDGYIEYMGDEAAYETGARIVRSYLQHHGSSIAEAHHITYDELYWASDCPFVR